MAIQAYQLQPKSLGFRLGREGLSHENAVETMPSDSFFGAIVSTLARIMPDELADFLAQFLGDNPPFRLSSLFPYIESVPLFPMPNLRINRQTETYDKTLKKLAYVSPLILNRLVKHQPMADWLPTNEVSNQGVLLHGGTVWISQTEFDGLSEDFHKITPKQRYQLKLWDNERVPRVTLDRQSNSPGIYQIGRTVFHPHAGLWFMADVQHAHDILDMAIVHLGDEGLGGERSVGYGGFTPKSFKIPALPQPKGADRLLTLSRYNPTLTELEAGVLRGDAAYQLVDVGGWSYSPVHAAQRRKRVRMIEAGSVLNGCDPLPVGRLVDVRPDGYSHPVYRSGISLMIGVTGGQDG